MIFKQLNLNQRWDSSRHYNSGSEYSLVSYPRHLFGRGGSGLTPLQGIQSADLALLTEWDIS